MSFNGYNLKNQKLSSEQMRTLLAFCSDNYAGAITEDTQKKVITVNGSKIAISNDYDFLVDGFLIHGGNGEEIDFTNENSGSLGAIIISTSIPSDEDNTITTDQINATVGLTGLTVVITVVDEVEKIDIKAGEKTIVEDYHCQTFEYDGNYIIPLACTINNVIRILLPCMSKSRLEEFLTESAYKKLQKWAEETFVWRVGGSDKGDIGDLNISGATIKLRPDNPHSYTAIVIDSPYIKLPGVAEIFEVNSGDVVCYDENIGGVYLSDVIQITQGGTGSKDKTGARINLGFYQGTGEPGTGDSANAVNGDIYFKILG